MKRCKLTALGFSFAAALGCSGAGHITDAGMDSGYYSLPLEPLSPLAACLELAAAEANFEVSCGRLAQADVGDSASGYIGAQCSPGFFAAEEAAFKAGTFAYSAAAVNCLVNALIAVSGSSTITCNIGYPELDPVCGQIAWGTLGPGESCSDQYACGDGLYCDRPSDSVCGVCTPDVGLGLKCGALGGGAFCTGGACNGNVCWPFASAAQGCELSAICPPPLTCLADGCQLPETVDGGCGTTADCADGLTCNAFSSRCYLGPVDGGDCSNQPCGWGQACMTSDAGFRCAPLLPGGDCIFTDAGPECPEFESCRDGGCFPLSPLDAGCGTTADCALGGCVSGRCRLLANGTTCSTPGECESDICDNVASETCVAGCQ